MDKRNTVENANTEIFTTTNYPTLKKKQEKSLGNLCINNVDFESLGCRKELTDSVIYGFLESRAELANTNGEKNIFVFDPLVTAQILKGRKYEVLVRKYSILKYPLWLWPICCNSHWVLFVISTKLKLSICLDSTLNSDKHINIVLPSIYEFVKYHCQIYNIHENVDNWIVHKAMDIPHQGPTVDCGVHSCVWAHIICTQMCTDFSSKDMNSARKFIMKVLLEWEPKDKAFPPIQAEMLLQSNDAVNKEFEETKKNYVMHHQWPTLQLCHNLLSYCNGFFTRKCVLHAASPLTFKSPNNPLEAPEVTKMQTVSHSQDSQVELEDKNGPWKEVNLGKRLKKTLDKGYLADLTVMIKNTKFRCHKNILSCSSLKLKNMISKNTHTLQLQNIEPNHFCYLLEIIYGGEADRLDKVKDVCEVAWLAKEYQVYTAVDYCTKILEKFVVPTSVLKIIDHAFVKNDGDFKNQCIKVVQEYTKEVLANEAFLNCNIATLKFILSQEVLQATELDLFLACARWAKKHENPRQALGSALGLIRFRILTADEFIKNVKPTQLLTAEEKIAFLSNFLDKDEKIPGGFSNEIKKRKMFLGKDETRKIGGEDEIKIDCYSGAKDIRTEELNKSALLGISATGDVNLIGINRYSRHCSVGMHMEDVTITLTDENETVFASATYCDEVEWHSIHCKIFKSSTNACQLILQSVS